MDISVCLKSLAGFALRRFVTVQRGLHSCYADLDNWLDLPPRWTIVVGLLLAGSDLVVVAGKSWWWLVVLCLCGVFIGQVRRNLGASVFLGCLPLVMAQYVTARAFASSENNIATVCAEQYVLLQGVVTDKWGTEGGRQSFLVAVDSVHSPSAHGRSVYSPSAHDPSAHGRSAHDPSAHDPSAYDPSAHSFPGRIDGAVALTLSKAVDCRGDVVSVGQRLSVRGKVCAGASAENPWDFDERAYLRRKGADCRLLAGQANVRCLGTDSRSIAKAETENPSLTLVRQRMCDIHRCTLGTTNGDLLSSMVIGDRAVHVSADLSRSFRNLGLSHILAASGFNLTVVIASVWWLCRWITRSRLVLNVVALAAMVFFVGLAGLSPSVQRAAIMCCMVLLSNCLFRKAYLPATISLALSVTLLVEPEAVADVGLQLSYFATGGIVCAASNFTQWIRSQIPQLWNWLCESIAVVVVAQLSVLAIQLLYFWQTGMFSLLANLLVSPLVPIISILGFASSALGMFGWSVLNLAAKGIDIAVSVPLGLMLLVIQWLAQFEWARILVGPPSPSAVIVYYASLILWFINLATKRQVWLGKAILCIAIGLLFVREPLPPLTIVCFPGACVIIDTDRRALVAGDINEVAKTRLLSYFGAHVASANPSGFCTEQTPDGTVLVDARTNTRVLVSGASQPGDQLGYTCKVTGREVSIGSVPNSRTLQINSSILLVRYAVNGDLQVCSERPSARIR